jgi:hypothetical protein
MTKAAKNPSKIRDQAGRYVEILNGTLTIYIVCRLSTQLIRLGNFK